MYDFEEQGTLGCGLVIVAVFALLMVAFALGKLLGPEQPAPKPPAQITINVTVQKPEQVRPTIEALSKALPKLEERK